ncbi:16S rRNA (guanine(966)-N(2))-methyltransferase RsmD [Candidatus Saccharibacteria bacterium]|nr:16S rRNA (guanine(966)-N(2))-methyltransferase RsmD [Candidatus Saccharibacteria bacterium]
MYMRIIAGKYGGRKIDAPDSSGRTHPMSERVRNAMFNSLGDTVLDVQVLDAFAGTGSIGLEAISRGAQQCTFIERDKVAQNALSKNVVSLGAADQSQIVRSSVNSWLQHNSESSYDIIFADPPYNNLQLSTVSELFGLLKPNGLMVLSWSGRGEGPNLKNGIVVVDNRSYGNAYLTFFRRVI